MAQTDPVVRYVKLMTRRIKWSGDEEDASASESDEEAPAGKPKKGNYCHLVWTGTVSHIYQTYYS